MREKPPEDDIGPWLIIRTNVELHDVPLTATVLGTNVVYGMVLLKEDRDHALKTYPKSRAIKLPVIADPNGVLANAKPYESIASVL